MSGQQVVSVEQPVHSRGVTDDGGAARCSADLYFYVTCCWVAVVVAPRSARRSLRIRAAGRLAAVANEFEENWAAIENVAGH